MVSEFWAFVFLLDLNSSWSESFVPAISSCSLILNSLFGWRWSVGKWVKLLRVVYLTSIVSVIVPKWDLLAYWIWAFRTLYIWISMIPLDSLFFLFMMGILFQFMGLTIVSRIWNPIDIFLGTLLTSEILKGYELKFQLSFWYMLLVCIVLGFIHILETDKCASGTCLAFFPD